HVIPASHFDGENNVDIPRAYRSVKLPWPLSSPYGCNNRLNFDGIVQFPEVNAYDKNHGYAQIYTTGLIEFVSQKIVSQGDARYAQLIPSDTFESAIIKGVEQSLAFYSFENIAGPYFILLTLLGVKGKYMAGASIAGDFDASPIDRDVLSVPDHRIDALDEDVDTALLPIFNHVWRAAGITGSPYYNYVTKKRDPRLAQT
ncbi:MAG TPA: hypothetical protein VFX22_02505, partial [Candidatus Kapabacteria bacterium]|nr:hypothetical protein [Candidatus Kapabacteria bacterium]